MCDYSLEAFKSRPAVVGEKLRTHCFGSGTNGFIGEESANNRGDPGATAVCLLPGTELAFDAPVEVKEWQKSYGSWPDWKQELHKAQSIEHRVARFTKINAEEHFKHHDGLEFPGQLGVEPVLLTHLVEGQTATVLQMPVTEEAKVAEAIEAKQPEYAD